jgi:hypothetical protein
LLGIMSSVLDQAKETHQHKPFYPEVSQ